MLTDVANLKAHDANHATEFNALSELVVGHGTTIASHTTAIAELNNNKADAVELANYYTKDEIKSVTGDVPTNKTLVQMIAEAQNAATYDDTIVRGLIDAEIDRATKAEQAIADDVATNLLSISTNAAAIETNVTAIAKNAEAISANTEAISLIDIALKAAIENNGEGLDSIKELATWIDEHGTEASDMAKAIETNADAIAAINDGTAGILAQANTYTDSAIAGLPAATVDALGLVRYDGTTIMKNENNQLYVAEVSTDILKQGKETLVLNGGTATT